MSWRPFSDGGGLHAGACLRLPFPDTGAICETFHRLVLNRLHNRQRLFDRFRESLLSWRHSGLSVFARQLILPEDPQQIDHIPRYLTRLLLRLVSVTVTDDGLVCVQTPPHPKTGETQTILDPLDWIWAITSQIPDPRPHTAPY